MHAIDRDVLAVFFKCFLTGSNPIFGVKGEKNWCLMGLGSIFGTAFPAFLPEEGAAFCYQWLQLGTPFCLRKSLQARQRNKPIPFLKNHVLASFLSIIFLDPKSQFQEGEEELIVAGVEVLVVAVVGVVRVVTVKDWKRLKIGKLSS